MKEIKKLLDLIEQHDLEIEQLIEDACFSASTLDGFPELSWEQARQFLLDFLEGYLVSFEGERK